ncbi:MAG: hypothetical protein ACRDH7_09310 [Actinomycetota bacterium]
MASAGTLELQVVADTSKLAASVAAGVSETTSRLGPAFASLKKTATSVFQGALAVGGLNLLIDKTLEYQHTVEGLAASFGITEQAAAQFNAVAQDVGVSATAIATPLIKLTKAAADSSKGVGLALEQWGVDTARFLASDPTTQIELLAQAYTNAGDKQNQFIAQVLGPRGKLVAPALKEWAIAEQAVGDQGFTLVTPEQAVQMRDFQRRLSDLAHILGAGIIGFLEQFHVALIAVGAAFVTFKLGSALASFAGALLNVEAAAALAAPEIAAVALAVGAIALAIQNAGGIFEQTLTPAVDRIVQLAQAQKLAQISGMSFADALAQVTAAAKENGGPLQNIDGLVAKLTTHVTGAGRQVRNFAGLTNKALQDFKASVIESVQVSIGEFSKITDAFKVTPAALKRQADAAVAIARREHRDLVAIFADRSLSQNAKEAIASLPADQRDAFAQAGEKVRSQVASDALKLQKLNDRNFHQLTTASRKGGTEAGQALAEGATAGVLAGSAAAARASAELGHQMLEALRSSLGIASPSKEGQRIGEQLLDGIILGLSHQGRALTKAAEQILKTLRDAVATVKTQIQTALGKGLTDAVDKSRQHLANLGDEIAHALDLSHAVDLAKRNLDKLAAHFRDFKRGIVAGFADLKDLAGSIGSLFGQTDENGNPIPVTGALISQTIADQVAQAQQLAALLKQAAAAGLSKNLLSQFAGQGAAAIPELQQLLADPQLIATLNQAAADIAAAAGDTAVALGDQFFGQAIRKAQHEFERLTERLQTFAEKIGVVIDVLKGLGDIQAPHLASGGIIRRPTLALVGESGPEAVVPLGHGIGTTINVTVNGWVGNDQALAKRLRNELVGIGRTNGSIF